MTDKNPYSTPQSEVADPYAETQVLTTDNLNPWFSMWIKPRATIQQIVDTNPEYLVLLLAMLGGVSQGLDRATGQSLGDQMPLMAVLGVAIVGGAVGGIIQLYIGGALLRWTGGWIGGQATSQYLRTAVAWSNVPLVWGLIIWVLAIAVFRQELFSDAMPRTEADPRLLYVLLAFGVINITLGIWSVVLLVKGVAQVQGFSAWKGLGNVVLASLVIIIPIAFIVGMLMM